MKQEIKDKLKICSKFAIVIGGILLWVVSFIGISAYSVYWIRQNANYELESVSNSIKKKQLNYDDDKHYLSSNNTKITSTIDYSNNEYDIQSYMYFAQSQEDYTKTYRYVCNGDFSYSINGTNLYFNQLLFSINFEVGGSGYTTSINYIQFRHYENGVSVRSQYVYDGLHYTDTTFSCSYSSISSVQGDISEVYKCSIMEFYFDVVYSSRSSTSFTFQSGSKNLPQYLNSYNRLQYGQIIYSSMDSNTDSLTIPMVFECNGILYDNITILLRPCWFYYNSAGQLINNENLRATNQIMPYVCAYVLFGYYGRQLDWTYSQDVAGIIENVNNGSLAMFLGYNGYSYEDMGSPAESFYAPNYLVVQGLQVVNDFQTISVADMNYVPFPNNTGANLKPYNNLSIKNILGGYFNFYGDINGYNGNDYDVGLGNVFILLSDAFSSIIPLLAIQIVPGITLGLLVLLPLVVTIILVILKLVKK